MKGISVLTNTGCSKQQTHLSNMAKGILNFSNLQRLCVTKKRTANVEAIKSPLSVMVIDPTSVPRQTALTYVEAINEKFSNKKPTFIIIGNQYSLPNVRNTTSWQDIKDLAIQN